jgi:hypothetical protein
LSLMSVATLLIISAPRYALLKLNPVRYKSALEITFHN